MRSGSFKSQVAKLRSSCFEATHRTIVEYLRPYAHFVAANLSGEFRKAALLTDEAWRCNTRFPCLRSCGCIELGAGAESGREFRICEMNLAEFQCPCRRLPTCCANVMAVTLPDLRPVVSAEARRADRQCRSVECSGCCALPSVSPKHSIAFPYWRFASPRLEGHHRPTSQAPAPVNESESNACFRYS